MSLVLSSSKQVLQPYPAPRARQFRRDADERCPLCLRSFEEQTPSRSQPANDAQHAQIFELPSYPLAGLIQSGSHFASLSSSLRNSPTSTPQRSNSPPLVPDQGLRPDSFIQGYYQRFFREERKLGQGARGVVYLCSHVLNGLLLGTYAVKKVSVGDSQRSLVESLREIKQLEAFRHNNIVAYHHAWLEMHQTSPFAPEIPHLFVLMEYANGGSLQDFVSMRLRDQRAASNSGRKNNLKQRFKERVSSGSHRSQEQNAVHLLRLDEIVSFFRDICKGLAYLHGQNILHCDLKADNVLLHFAEDTIRPTCRIADFGNSESRDRLSRRRRTGATGTIDYLSPEALPDPCTGELRESSAACDMWSAGLLLHLLVFFKLPYLEEEDVEGILSEIRSYPGYLDGSSQARRDIPFSIHRIMSQLLHRDPRKRPPAEQVVQALDRMDAGEQSNNKTSVVRRQSSPPAYALANKFRLAIESSRFETIPGSTEIVRYDRQQLFIVSAFVKIYILFRLKASVWWLLICFAELTRPFPYGSILSNTVFLYVTDDLYSRLALVCDRVF